MTHYVTNKLFYDALVERKRKRVDNPELQVTNYIGECFVKIATNLAHKHNFNGYSYKDEMIADAIESCLAAVDKFDTEKYQNPFAYFTQCAYFAFLQRISREKKQQEIKGELILKMVDEGLFSLNGEDNAEDFDLSFIEEVRSSSYLPQKKEKKKKEEPVGLTVFCDGVNELEDTL